MDISRGYVRLFRQIDEWEWYDNPFVKAIFLHCLIKANDKAKKWRDLTLKRGQFVTSYEKLAASNGMTIQQTRTALKQLQLTNEIEYQSTNQYTVITVKNFNLYQATNTQKIKADNPPTNKPNEGQVTTTNNIYKDTNNIYNISSSSIDFEKFLKNLKKEEEEELRNYSKKNKIKYFRPWLRKLYENGDIEDIKLKAKNYAERIRQKQAEKIPPEIEEKSSPEDEQRGLELLRRTAQKIKKGA